MATRTTSLRAALTKVKLHRAHTKQRVRIQQLVHIKHLAHLRKATRQLALMVPPLEATRHLVHTNNQVLPVRHLLAATVHRAELITRSNSTAMVTSKHNTVTNLQGPIADRQANNLRHTINIHKAGTTNILLHRLVGLQASTSTVDSRARAMEVNSHFHHLLRMISLVNIKLTTSTQQDMEHSMAVTAVATTNNSIKLRQILVGDEERGDGRVVWQKRCLVAFASTMHQRGTPLCAQKMTMKCGVDACTG